VKNNSRKSKEKRRRVVQELKMYVFQTRDRGQATIDKFDLPVVETIGVVVTEWGEWAKEAAIDTFGQAGEEADEITDYLCMAVMLIDDAGAQGVEHGGVVVEMMKTGLAVVEEAHPSSALLPAGVDGERVRLLQCVEFDETKPHVHGEETSNAGEFLWLGTSGLWCAVHPDWGELGFKLTVVNESEMYAKMPYKELARRGLLRTAIQVEPNSAVLVMSEGKPVTAYVIDEEGEMTEVDSRAMVKTIVEAELERQHMEEEKIDDAETERGERGERERSEDDDGRG